MKRIIYLPLLAILASSCQKDIKIKLPPDQPAMKYTDLRDTAIRLNKSAAFDINGDGQWDVFFGTMLVGDPIAGVDKHQWLVATSFHSNLPVNDNESIPVLQKDHIIPINNFAGYSWFNASTVVLAQKVIGNNPPPIWEGDWKNVNHHFIPVQVSTNGGLYNGWVEVSFSTTEEKLFVHKAAISKVAGKEVKAGI